MLESRVSAHREHLRSKLIQTLNLLQQNSGVPFLYMEARANLIVTTLIPNSQLVGIGFTKIYTAEDPPKQEIERIALVTVLNEPAISELERYWHLFGSISLLNLTISGTQSKELLRVSPLRKKLKGLVEISFNFLTFVDSVYFAEPIVKDHERQESIPFEEALTSLLISMPKFHQFEFYCPNSSSAPSLGTSVKQALERKLNILSSHKAKEYTEQSSPRTKVLLLQRKMDQMSPLVYSYHFGPIAQQLQTLAIQDSEFGINSALFRALYPMDLQQASNFLQGIASDKAKNQKQKFELHQFQKAKQIISKHYDEATSPQQIQLQIQILASVKKFCQRRLYTAALEQTIINARSETDMPMSPSKVVDFVVELANCPVEQYKPFQEDYIKIVILSYMVNSFWFWHRRILNAGLETPDRDHIIRFCKRVQGKYKPLQQKPQGEQRFDLYRHQPLLVEATKRWIKKNKSEDHLFWQVNPSSLNRQSNKIIAIKGPLGYGELALLMRQLKESDPQGKYTIFCSSLTTTKDYLKIILGSNSGK